MDSLLLLAMVIQGEVGLVPQAMPLVAHAVMNRVADHRWPDTVIGVLEQPHQWNGRADPSSLAYYWARRALRRDRDPTGGILFVISGDDRKVLDCDRGDVIYVVPDHSVHGYRSWCKEKR